MNPHQTAILFLHITQVLSLHPSRPDRLEHVPDVMYLRQKLEPINYLELDVWQTPESSAINNG